MSQPFRDDTVALRSMVDELARENAALREEVGLLRAASPENGAAVSRRLREENEELRGRVRELEAVEREVKELRDRERAASDAVADEPSYAEVVSTRVTAALMWVWPGRGRSRQSLRKQGP